EGFGLALASVIARQSIYKNQPLQEYISFVGSHIVEASDVPDIQFRFYILDIQQPNAYACPGGYIFVTRGMLKSLVSEAELAFVLAHEIAHVSRFHGLVEAEQRKHHISADAVFDELDSELPDAFSDAAKRTEAELEDQIMSMFENLI
ncbi:MAG: M48 family metalloprotease, partial [Candidatus Cloacimonadaceae bacterium]|nr:M48 family metalloprotease [Candidatus Cloacimonadaceae bacterium]